MSIKVHLIQNCLLGAALIAALTTGAQPTLTQITGGSLHNLFLKSDGSLWGMGMFANGELGDGSAVATINSYDYSQYFPYEMLNGVTGIRRGGIPLGINHPEQIVSGGVMAIAAGDGFSLFLKSDHTLWGMGKNSSGQLGDGTTTPYVTLPEHIVPPGLGSISAIAAGGSHSLFIKQRGSIVELWGMGDNYYGELGDGTTSNRPTPVKILSADTSHGAPPVTAIAVGGDHSLFLKADGSLWAMGYNGRGQLGDSTTTDRHVPVEIESSGVTAIAAGYWNSMFVKSDGSLWAMGDNSHGQLGIFSFNSNPNPTPVHSLASGVTAIACGNGFGLFVENDGSLWSMGEGSAGQLGNNATSDINLPQNVASGVTAVAAGDSTSLFIKSDGSLWVMGLNSQGQLGDFGDFQNVDVPEQIVTVPPPQVGIATYGNQAIVFFPLNSASNYVLQTSGSLTGGNWVACTNQIPMAALLITNAGNAFFRLH